MQANPVEHTSQSRSVAVLSAFFLIALGLGAVGCNRTTTIDCDQGADGGSSACVCEYNGKGYPAGAGFKDAEGCNDCSCQDDGTVVCTLKLCVSHCGGLNDPGCPDGQYCDYPVYALCGAADGTGICKEPSEICQEIYKPVCGCDDKTYENACAASRASVSVAYESECSAGCDYNDQHYEVGASFPSADGCNDCFCSAGGQVGCTKRACLPAAP